MSDFFVMLVDQDVRIEEANETMARVLHRFRDDGLIVGELDADCVLGGEGYRPGPALPKVYELSDSEHPFWELHVCGVEPQVGRAFNYWAYGPSHEGFSCPICKTEYGSDDNRLSDEFSQAIGQWVEESGPALVRCVICAREVPLTEWLWTPPLGFGNLSFRFWNWAPFESLAWRINIRTIMEEVTGHRVVYTYGRI
jgi:hypothetical protein